MLFFDRAEPKIARFGDTSGRSPSRSSRAERVYDALKRVWGARVQYEPADSMSYSDHRPDLTVRDGADFWAIDLKVFDPIGSDCGQVEHRGAFVACGNTRPEARRLVIGLRARGVAGTNFNPSTGLGHVAAQDGHYARAEAHGVRPLPALFETFGGVGPELYEFLGKAAEAVQNKLSKGEYDETTWAARTWLGFVGQRLSVAAQLAMTEEIAQALGLAAVGDPRGRE